MQTRRAINALREKSRLDLKKSYLQKKYGEREKAEYYRDRMALEERFAKSNEEVLLKAMRLSIVFDPRFVLPCGHCFHVSCIGSRVACPKKGCGKFIATPSDEDEQMERKIEADVNECLQEMER